MVFKIVHTELKRDFHNAASTFAFSFLLGFILFFVAGFSNYLNRIFDPPKWNADLVILPKGISPELAVSDLIKGSPDGLIPLALFKTLLQQSSGSTIKILGFIPFKNADGVAEIAVTDSELKGFPDLKVNSLWSDVNFTSLDLQRAQFRPIEIYQTPEWQDQVLMGILAKGGSGEITGLKNLIDRKTIAQAFYVGSDKSELHTKHMQLKRGLYASTAFVFFSTFLGLLLSLKNMKSKRKPLELVLKELKIKPAVLVQVKLMQMLILTLIPSALGFLLCALSFDIIQRFIFSI